MPRVTNTNTNAPVIVIAEKIAEDILKLYRNGLETVIIEITGQNSK